MHINTIAAMWKPSARDRAILSNTLPLKACFNAAKDKIIKQVIRYAAVF
jgi:hypothetical protein